MKIRWKFWQREQAPIEEPLSLESGLTILDGRYGRLAHLLDYDPDDYGWKGKDPETMLAIFNTPVSPAERYGFNPLTLDDIKHALSGAYKGDK